MIKSSPMDSIPLWLIAVMIIVILSVVIELGFQLGKRIAREKGLSKHPVEAAVCTALLGLLTFMTAFTFNAAVSRYVKLRSLGTADANLAHGLYLTADYLKEGEVSKAKSLIREYVEVRSRAVINQDPEEIKTAIARSSDIQQELWEMGVKDGSPQVRLYVVALTKLIENDATRQTAALVNRLPGIIWISLGSLSAMAMVLLGLSAGLHGRRSRLVVTVFIGAYSLVMILIVDLDRPMRTFFKMGDPAADRALSLMK